MVAAFNLRATVRAVHGFQCCHVLQGRGGPLPLCPASARTLATSRACRFFVGWRACWQGVHSALAPRLSLLHAFQLEGACVLKRLFERQQLVVFRSNRTSAQPVRVPLPPLVLVGSVRGRGYVDRACTALAPRLPVFLALQLEGTYLQHRHLE